MIVSHLPVYNYVATILLYIQACALYYCYCSAKVPTRLGWIYRDENPGYTGLSSVFSVYASAVSLPA
jgi:hypothetical protein